MASRDADNEGNEMINLTAAVQRKQTKAQLKASLQSAIDHACNVSRQRIEEMKSQSQNPQVALMIEKNKGYIMALEDVTELLYGHRVF